jgi:oligoendopeptidase F
MAGFAQVGVPGFAKAAAIPTRWRVTDLYPDDRTWQAERTDLLREFQNLSELKGNLTATSQALLSGLDAVGHLRRRLGKFTLYATLLADEDRRPAANQERLQIAASLSAEFAQATAWINPELLNAGAEAVRMLSDKVPAMARHNRFLSDLFRMAPHTLDAEGERILAAASAVLESPSGIRDILMATEIPFPIVSVSGTDQRINPQGFVRYRSSANRTERKNVCDQFFTALKSYEAGLGAALNAQIQSHVFIANARHFSSSLESALAPANIPTAVYRTLINEARRGLPVLARFFEVRRKLLRIPRLELFDLYTPIVELDREYTVDTARLIAINAFEPLGKDYVNLFAESSLKPWVDVYPRPGKRAGNYVDDGAYDVHPYMMLNYTNDYAGMASYVHEWGHMMHTLFAKQAQPYETASYSIFAGEIASTLNEQLLAEYLVRRAKSNVEKLFYLDRLCDLYVSKFYRQSMLAEFELAIHEASETGDAVSGSQMTDIYHGLLNAYYGQTVAIDPAYAVEWANVPHFFFNFYVYQYATCLSASAFFANNILNGAKGAVDSYLSMLRAGGSDAPLDVLKKGGIDMLSPHPYRALVDRFERVVSEIERWA